VLREPLLLASPAVGVGQVGENPNALAAMRRANVGRSQHSPFRIIPERGKVAEHAVESSSSESWRIFHADKSRSYLAHDASVLAPQSRTRAIEAGACAGDGYVLTGKASRNHVNTASPWSTVKGSHVIPDRERGQRAVILPCEKNGGGVGVALDGADGSPPKERAAEYAATSARE